MKSKTLLIDLDGTLLGANPVGLRYHFILNFVRSLRANGFGIWRSIKILHQLKLSMRDPAHQKNGVFNWEKENKSFSQLSGLSLEKSRPLLELTSMRCFKGARSSLYAIPEAQEFIRFARNHYRLILATNPMWPLAVVEYRLELAEIEKENFEFITHAENMSAIKPYVEYYRELVEGLGLKASECLMIGNDPKKDGPAKALGIEVLIIKSPADFLGLKSRLEKEVRLLS